MKSEVLREELVECVESLISKLESLISKLEEEERAMDERWPCYCSDCPVKNKDRRCLTCIHWSDMHPEYTAKRRFAYIGYMGFCDKTHSYLAQCGLCGYWEKKEESSDEEVD